MKLDAVKLSLDAFSSRRLSQVIGDVSIPYIPDLASQVADSSEPIALQNIKWSKNPFSFAGNGGQLVDAESLSAELAGELSCCTVNEKAVQSMEIRSGGTALTVEGLVDPIILKLERPSRPSSANNSNDDDIVNVCQYFDHNLSTWTDRGCKLANVTQDHLVCECTHLSSFAGGLGTITPVVSVPVDSSPVVSVAVGSVITLECLNTDVFTKEALDAVARGGYFQRVSIISVMSCTVVLALLMIIAHRYDSYYRKKWQWDESHLIGGMNIGGRSISSAPDEDPEKEATETNPDIESPASKGAPKESGGGNTLVKYCVGLYAKGKLGMTIRTLTSLPVHSRKLGIEDEAGNRQSLWSEAGERQQQDGFETQTVEVSPAGKQTPVRDKVTAVVMLRDNVSSVLEEQDVRKECFCSLFCVYLSVMQPLMTVGHFCVHRGACMRLLIFSVQFYGQLAASALFYSTESPCKQEEFWADLLQSIIVGILSVAISVIPGCILSIFASKELQLVDDDARTRRRVLRKFCCQKAFVWITGSLLILACLAYTVMFIVSSPATRENDWLLSAVAALLMVQLVGPFCAAFCLTCLVKSCVSQRTHEQARKSIGVHFSFKEASQSQDIVPPQVGPVTRPKDECLYGESLPDVRRTTKPRGLLVEQPESEPSGGLEDSSFFQQLPDDSCVIGDYADSQHLHIGSFEDTRAVDDDCMPVLTWTYEK